MPITIHGSRKFYEEEEFYNYIIIYTYNLKNNDKFNPFPQST